MKRIATFGSASALLAAATFLAAPAWAQDDEDLDIDDILGEDTSDDGKDGKDGGDALDDILADDKKGQSADEEIKDLKEGRIDDKVGVKEDSILLPEEQTGKKRLIKTLQRKTFLKIGRSEVGPHIGFVTNDPFINRYLVGASYAYHVTEIFAVEASGTFSPDFGVGDWKPITDQLVNENKVSPDISKIIWYANANFQYSPIYGKIAVLGRSIINFDVFGLFGMGVVSTDDDLKALQAEEDQAAIDTEVQIHPTTNFGGGFRVIFSKNFSARLEGRSMIYIETISSTTLEMKNNFMLQTSATFFFPGVK